MISFKQHLQEALRILPDERIDQFIDKEWDGAVTYHYNAEASLELAKVLPDVIITKDKEWVHIPGVLDAKLNKEVNRIEQKYNLKALDESQQLEMLEEGIKDIISNIKSKIFMLKDLPKLRSIRGIDIENPETSFDKIGKEIGADSEMIKQAKEAVKSFKRDSMIAKIGSGSMSIALSSTLVGSITKILNEVPVLKPIVQANTITTMTLLGILLLVTFLSTLYYIYKD